MSDYLLEKESIQISAIPTEQLEKADITKSRIATCDSCDKMTVTLGVKRCTVCDCFVRLKASISNATCPLEKWNA